VRDEQHRREEDHKINPDTQFYNQKYWGMKWKSCMMICCLFDDFWFEMEYYWSSRGRYVIFFLSKVKIRVLILNDWILWYVEASCWLDKPDAW
jgi:hypothetical protein